MDFLPILFTNNIIVFDNFNRPNNNATLNEKGQQWNVTGASWGIIDNKAYPTGTTGQENAYIFTGNANVEVSADITFSVNEGVIVRFLNASNFVFARIISGGISLFRKSGGIDTALGTYSFNANVGNVYNIKITCLGSSIKVYLDGVERISVNETFGVTNVRHGMRVNSSTNGRFDNFLVEAL